MFLRDHVLRTGGTTYMLETLPQLESAHIRSSVCVLESPSSACDSLVRAGIPVDFLKHGKRDPRRFTDLDSVLRRRRPDILHLLGPKSFMRGRLLGLWHGIPTITHFHSMLSEPPWMRAAQRRLARYTALGLAPSKATADWAAQEYALPRDQVRVLDYGFDAQSYDIQDATARLAIRREWGIPQDAPVIGLPGRVIIAQKGQDIMIKLMPRLLERIPGLVLMIIGEGPDLALCRRIAQHTGTPQSIVFTGYRHDIPRILSAVDIVVVPSIWEDAHPFVALEAAAAGRPVVGFRSGGLPEAIRHSETGIIVPKGDADQLCTALIELFSNAELAQLLGKQGRIHARKFSFEKHVLQLTKIYQQLLLKQTRMADTIGKRPASDSKEED